MAKPHWKDEPDEHDYPAAQSYLSLVVAVPEARRLVQRLRRSGIDHYKAKDLLRASRLPLLDADNVHVAKDLAKVKRGDRLSPVLLIRGNVAVDSPLVVADGYHRICASYHLDEDADIPCRVIDAPGIRRALTGGWNSRVLLEKGQALLVESLDVLVDRSV